MKTNEELKNTPNLLIARTAPDGGCGEIFQFGKRWASVIWSNGGGWDHVSIAPYNRRITPDWNDMCRLKDMFFREDEVVIQYHPAKSGYVNNVPNCLHLWKSQKQDMPTPPSVMVGVKKGQSISEIRDSIKAVSE